MMLAVRQNNRYYSRRVRSEGFERALEHIREAKAFTREIGGIDSDVKKYFFGLSNRELIPILKAYGKRYGFKARQYAEEALPKWMSGQVKMSGMVAKRLFSLLPVHMPLKKKYELVKSLWEFCGNPSKLELYAGPEVSEQELLDRIKVHFDQEINGHKISETITNRFKWLSAKDVQLKENLLNYYESLEKECLKEGIEQLIPSLLKALRQREGSASAFNQKTSFGRHVVFVEVSPQHEGISESKSYVSSSESESVFGWCILIGFLALLYFLFT